MTRLRAAFAVAALSLWLCSGEATAKPPLDAPASPPDPPGAGRLERTTPGQLPGTLPPRLVGPGPFQRLPSIDDSQWISLVRDLPIGQAGTRDPVLTNACRQGDFATPSFNSLVVRFTDAAGPGLLQVVPPALRHLLADRRRLARPNEVYYFHSAGQPDCEVWVAGQGKPRSLDRKRGTSLPPADPHALAKEKALIASWPKQ